MGMEVERPTLRKKRFLSTEEAPKGSREMDHTSWQWGPFQNLSIDDAMFHSSNIPRTLAGALFDSPDSSKQLISPSLTGSSSPSSSSPLAYSPTSPPFSGGCVDPFGGKVASHRRLKKGSEGQGMSFACNGDFRPSRWDSGRWSGNSSFNERSKSPGGNSLCKCAAGVTADVAVVCCCPFSLLHLLAIAFIKLPAALVSKTMSRIKRKLVSKRKRSAVHEEDDVTSIPATSCPPSRSRSYEEGDIQTWAPALAFGDQKLWCDYFDSPNTDVWSSGELLRAKS